MSVIQRIHETIAAVCPIDGISGSTQGSVRIDYAAGATAPQRAAADAALAAFDWSAGAQTAWQNLKDRATVAALVADTGVDGKTLRAIASVLIDEINNLRQWITAFKAAAAASTNYATLKSGIAGLSNTPDRTLAQAKTAITNAINAGTAD